MHKLLKTIRDKRNNGEIYKVDLFIVNNEYTLRIPHGNEQLFIAPDCVYCNVVKNRPTKKELVKISDEIDNLNLDKLAQLAKEATKAYRAKEANLDSSHY